MSARTAIVTTFLLAAIIGAAVVVNQEISHLRRELSETKDMLAANQAELAANRAELTANLADVRRSAEEEASSTRTEFATTRAELADVRRSAEEEAASTRTELLDLHRRLADATTLTASATTTSHEPGAPGGTKRVLQDDGGGSTDSETCLDPNSVAVAALDLAHAANEELVRILPVIDSKANATDLEDTRSRLEDFAAALSTATGQPVAPDETLACQCSVCAEPLAGGGLCEPWQESAECECSADDAPAGAPVRQTFPVTQADPECCRAEYLEAVTVTQMREQSEHESTLYYEVYDQDEVVIKINGQVTFSFTGFENVEQTNSNWQQMEGGIRSGDPATGGSFQHTFDTPGVYYFNSYVHTTLRLKVTVMDCVFCNVIQGYDGAEPDSLAHALSSRVPGNYSLHVDNFASHGVITYLTVYARQILTITGRVVASGQLALLDAMIHILDEGTLILNAVHVSSAVTQELRGTLVDNTGRVVADHPGLPLPLAQEELPSCEIGDRPAVIMFRNPELDMDVLLSCSVLDGAAGWRQVLTMGGVTFDGEDVAAFLSSIASGLPGKYVLRVVGAGGEVIISALDIHPYQDVRVVCTATAGPRLTIAGNIDIAAFGAFMIRGEGTALAFEEAGEVESSATISFQGRISAAADTSVSLSVDVALLEFQDTLDMGVGSSLVIEGAIDILDFRAGFSISTGATGVLRSSETDSIGIALGTTFYAIDPVTNQGSVTFHEVALLGTQGAAAPPFGNVSGVLPGDLAVSLNGQQPGGGGAIEDTVSLSQDGTVTVPPLLNAAMGRVFTDDNIAEFVAMVNEGNGGLYGLQLTRADQDFAITAMSVSLGQDVRLFSTAPGSSVTFLDTVDVSGSLTARGMITTLTFASTTTLARDASLILRLNEDEETPAAGTGIVFTGDVTLGAASGMTVDGTTSAVTFESRFIIGQDATVSMTVTADEVTFIGSVDHGGSSFDIEGTVTTLSFPGNLQIASGSTASVVSSSENSVRVALGTIWYAIDPSSNQGSISFDSVGLLLGGTDVGTRFGTVAGTLPGDLSVELNGRQPGGGGTVSGVASLSADGTVSIPDNLNSAVGQVYTEADIPGFISRVQEAAPGLYGLQLSTADQAFVVSELAVATGQDVRVFSTAAGSSVEFGDVNVDGTGAVLTVRGLMTSLLFSGATSVSAGAGLSVEGTIDYLEFPGGLAVAAASTAAILSSTDRSIKVALGTPWYAIDPTYNQGSFTLQGVALLDTDRAEFGVIDGVLPGDLSVSLDENQPGGTGVQSGIVSLAVDGTVNIPDNLNSAMGQVFTDANIDDFVAAVNSGATGLIGLQISTDGQALELGAMDVVSGQDVRVFSTASDTTLASIAGADVEEGGMLTVSGTVQLTDFALVGVAWVSANSGTVAFDGGVTAVLPDGTAPSISGSIPGTLTAEWGGSTVVSIARSDSSATASFTPSDWSAVQWFGDANIDDFVAAVNSGATGLIGLQISTDGQALELGAMNVVSGQDVRVFSTASEVTVTHTGALSVATGAMLTISGTISSLDFYRGADSTGAFDVAAGGTLQLSGQIALPYGGWLISAALRADGAVVLGGGLTMPLADGTAVSLDGELPGQITAQRDGATVGTVSRDGTGTVAASPDGWYGVVVTIKAWGGGGGAGDTSGCGQSVGGAGGFATADYFALAGETLTVVVGGGGHSNPSGSAHSQGGSPNGGEGKFYSSYTGGGGGGASFASTSRNAIGVILGAGGGGGAAAGSNAGGGGGGGGGTHDGQVGSGGNGGTNSNGANGVNGNGGGGGGYRNQPAGSSDHGGAGDRAGNNQCGNGCNCGGNSNGAGGLRPSTTCQDSGAGGGGAASSKGVVEGTFRTVDGVCGPSQNYAGHTPVNQDDPHYSSSGNGQGGASEDISGTRGRVVLIVGGEPTFFDSPGSEATFVVQ